MSIDSGRSQNYEYLGYNCLSLDIPLRNLLIAFEEFCQRNENREN